MEAGRRRVSALEFAQLTWLYRQPFEFFLGEPYDAVHDSTTEALLRVVQDLSDHNRREVLRFAESLRDFDFPPAGNPTAHP